MPWSDGEDDSSSDESSTLDTDTESNDGSGENNKKSSVISSRPSKGKTSEGNLFFQLFFFLWIF